MQKYIVFGRAVIDRIFSIDILIENYHDISIYRLTMLFSSELIQNARRRHCFCSQRHKVNTITLYFHILTCCVTEITGNGGLI